MKFLDTPLHDAWLIALEGRSDERGFFARQFCINEFAERGLDSTVVQANLSFNHAAGTLRGMHFQEGDAAETKVVTCTRGAVHDVIVDLRPDSASYLQHFGVELNESNRLSLYVPKGFAHGYLTLSADAEVTYRVSQMYAPGSEGGFAYDDPVFGIEWPAPVTVISEKDRNWAGYTTLLR